MEVLTIVLCPSSLAHWLVGFWSGDSHCFFCFFFVFFLFLFFFVSGFLACFFFLFFFFFCFFYLFGDFQSLLASACHKTMC